MSNEASKTRQLWTEREWLYLSGRGIDIGCGNDPVRPDVRRFDVEDGDANVITRHVQEQFDFVFSSHCLEHMHDPRAALREWWSLVRPGGYLFFIVPDEDLYEQGVFPSRFNSDHKATFTIEKRASWSPVSHNIRDLVATLAGAELVSTEVQDNGYDRSLLHFDHRPSLLRRAVAWVYWGLRRRFHLSVGRLERWLRRSPGVDQTLRPGVLAQIQTIVRKRLA